VADPTTVNVALAIPVRGTDVGTWDLPVNGDFSALDGFQGGIQAITLSNSPVTLSVPAGFTATPSAGPTQAQNAVLRFSGALSSGVTVTLPMSGYYIIENLTTGAFVTTFRAIGSGEIIAVDQGEVQHIYNDGTNVRFVNLGRIGHREYWDGLTAMPPWVASCTKPPYLLCDGTVYNFSTYPYLGARLLGAFGGNGITTFGVPDLRGRVGLPFDGTFARITVAGCGLNGQTLGAAIDTQSETLTVAQLPTGITSNANNNISVSINGIGAGSGIPFTSTPANIQPTTVSAAPGPVVPDSTSGSWGGVTPLSSGVNNISVTSNNTSGSSHPNVQPSLVTGIAVIRAA